MRAGNVVLLIDAGTVGRVSRAKRQSRTSRSGSLRRAASCCAVSSWADDIADSLGREAKPVANGWIMPLGPRRVIPASRGEAEKWRKERAGSRRGRFLLGHQPRPAAGDLSRHAESARSEIPAPVFYPSGRLSDWLGPTLAPGFFSPLSRPHRLPIHPGPPAVMVGTLHAWRWSPRNGWVLRLVSWEFSYF